MDLYCDCAECDKRQMKVRQYIGETWGDVVRQARKDGWRIGRDKQTAYAPGHFNPRRRM